MNSCELIRVECRLRIFIYLCVQVVSRSSNEEFSFEEFRGVQSLYFRSFKSHDFYFLVIWCFHLSGFHFLHLKTTFPSPQYSTFFPEPGLPTLCNPSSLYSVCVFVCEYTCVCVCWMQPKCGRLYI